jgi:hypothetical protein
MYSLMKKIVCQRDSISSPHFRARWSSCGRAAGPNSRFGRHQCRCGLYPHEVACGRIRRLHSGDFHRLIENQDLFVNVLILNEVATGRLLEKDSQTCPEVYAQRERWKGRRHSGFRRIERAEPNVEGNTRQG